MFSIILTEPTSFYLLVHSFFDMDLPLETFERFQDEPVPIMISFLFLWSPLVRESGTGLL